MKTAMQYKLWRESVIRILYHQGHIKYTNKVSENIYDVYFNEGFSPSEAVKEDLGIDAIKYFNYNETYQNK